MVKGEWSSNQNYAPYQEHTSDFQKPPSPSSPPSLPAPPPRSPAAVTCWSPVSWFTPVAGGTTCAAGSSLLKAGSQAIRKPGCKSWAQTVSCGGAFKFPSELFIPALGGETTAPFRDTHRCRPEMTSEARCRQTADCKRRVETLGTGFHSFA